MEDLKTLKSLITGLLPAGGPDDEEGISLGELHKTFTKRHSKELRDEVGAVQSSTPVLKAP